MKRFLQKYAAWGCALLCLLLGVGMARVVAVGRGSWVVTAVMLLPVAGVGYGLWRQLRWALRTTAIMLLLAAVIFPVGAFSPFMAGDYLAAGAEPPSLFRTLAWLVPVEATVVALAWVLDPEKRPAASNR